MDLGIFRCFSTRDTPLLLRLVQEMGVIEGVIMDLIDGNASRLIVLSNAMAHYRGNTICLLIDRNRTVFSRVFRCI